MGQSRKSKVERTARITKPRNNPYTLTVTKQENRIIGGRAVTVRLSTGTSGHTKTFSGKNLKKQIRRWLADNNVNDYLLEPTVNQIFPLPDVQ
jgi:hypothetical protein